MSTTHTYDRLAASKKELAAAEKILDLIVAEFPKDAESQANAIWLAFQAHHGPASAGMALRHYGFICSHK